jgi:hypothetical protein
MTRLLYSYPCARTILAAVGATVLITKVAGFVAEVLP